MESITIESSCGPLSLNFHATSNELNQIKNWLIKSHKKDGDGFYSNWSTILNRFANDQMATLSSKGEPIGFACWNQESGPLVYLYFVEINPLYQNKGIGKLFVHALLYGLQSEGSSIAYLESIDAHSTIFWKKCGFHSYPPDSDMSGYSERVQSHMYRIQANHAFPTSESLNTGKTSLELWNGEPEHLSSNNIKWEWELEFKDVSTRLKTPIIHPCSPDWALRLTICGIESYFGKVKSWREEIYNNYFLVIDDIPYFKPHTATTLKTAF